MAVTQDGAVVRGDELTLGYIKARKMAIVWWVMVSKGRASHVSRVSDG